MRPDIVKLANSLRGSWRLPVLGASKNLRSRKLVRPKLVVRSLIFPKGRVV